MAAVSSEGTSVFIGQLSVSQRLQALKSEQDSWRTKITPESADFSRGVRAKFGDRLKTLTEAQTGWKARVQSENDAHQFRPKHSSLVTPKRRPVEKTSTSSEQNTPVVRRPPSGQQCRAVPARSETSALDSFFPQVTYSVIPCTLTEASVSTICLYGDSKRLSATKVVPPPNRNNRSSANPVRALAARADLVTEAEARRPKSCIAAIAAGVVPRGSPHQHLAREAVAGLESTEDFSAVRLRKNSGDSPPDRDASQLPYRPKMLILVKGRRHVQCRLIQPNVQSINSDDCFVLVCPKKIYSFIGQESNVMQKAKAKELSSALLRNRDMGVQKDYSLVMVEEAKLTADADRFANALDGSVGDLRARPSPYGAGEEEELEFEELVTSADRIYEYDGAAFQLDESRIGKPLRHSLLVPHRVLAFDFGTEFYVWFGVDVKNTTRKVCLKLARDIFEKSRSSSAWTKAYKSDDSSCSSRPDWLVFGRQCQNMETMLFRSKFCDWPENVVVRSRSNSRPRSNFEIPVQKLSLQNNRTSDTAYVEPSHAQPSVLAARLFAAERREVGYEFEGTELGRGTLVEDVTDPLRRKFKITTEDITVWNVRDGDHELVPEERHGQFYSGETFIIRWHYMVSQTDNRTLKGELSRHGDRGRDRTAFWFWHGGDTSVGERAAAALQTVELDAERGPHARVEQGGEPPVFSSMFEGRMIIWRGKRRTARKSQTHMFALMGSFVAEACLVEVDCCRANLRSQSSYVVVDNARSVVYVWHGSYSMEHTREIVLGCAKRISSTYSTREIFEDADSHLSSILGSSPYPRVPAAATTPRAFQFSAYGQFDALEMNTPSFTAKHYCPFPFRQQDIYDLLQPCLVLFEFTNCVYLWGGWLPEQRPTTAAELQEDIVSAAQDFDSARLQLLKTLKEALKTVVEYGKEAKKSSFIIWAGHEPSDFIAHFPSWNVDENVKKLNAPLSHVCKEPQSAVAASAHFNRDVYSLAELRAKPLPDGVDVMRLEQYLTLDDFQECFAMTKAEFGKLPAWKQLSLKQEAKLF